MLLLEVDASSVVSLMVNAADTNSEFAPLVDDCRDLLKRFPQAQIKHCYREGNKCADRLARLGTDLGGKFCCFCCPSLCYCSPVSFG